MLLRWMPAALGYVAYQLINHEVSYLCSLSERVVFLNLTPAITLLLESVLMPPNQRTKATTPVVVSLLLMVVGAIVFSLEYPDFTVSGLLAAASMIAAAIPYRLLQRWLLLACPELPL